MATHLKWFECRMNAGVRLGSRACCLARPKGRNLYCFGKMTQQRSRSPRHTVQMDAQFDLFRLGRRGNWEGGPTCGALYNPLEFFVIPFRSLFMIMYPWRLLGRRPTEPTPFTGARADCPSQARNDEQRSIGSRPSEDRYKANESFTRSGTHGERSA